MMEFAEIHGTAIRKLLLGFDPFFISESSRLVSTSAFVGGYMHARRIIHHTCYTVLFKNIHPSRHAYEALLSLTLLAV